MSNPRYHFITRPEEARLVEAASRVLGRRIEAVRCYEHDWGEPADWLGPEATRPGEAVPMLGPRRDAHGHAYHQLDDALVLDLDDGSALEIGAVMPGFSWGIAVLHGAPLPPLEDRIVTDAGASRAWRPLLGRPIVSVRAAWHANDHGEPATVWSLALELEGGDIVAVALGEDHEGTLIPHPSGLVVLFGAEIAAEHGSPDAGDPAIGIRPSRLG